MGSSEPICSNLFVLRYTMTMMHLEVQMIGGNGGAAFCNGPAPCDGQALCLREIAESVGRCFIVSVISIAKVQHSYVKYFAFIAAWILSHIESTGRWHAQTISRLMWAACHNAVFFFLFHLDA